MLKLVIEYYTISERDFHRFLAREDNGHITDYRMSRVTFGVKSSPFLASAVLRKGAIDNADSHPTATLVYKQFYVDDLKEQTIPRLEPSNYQHSLPSYPTLLTSISRAINNSRPSTNFHPKRLIDRIKNLSGP